MLEDPFVTLLDDSGIYLSLLSTAIEAVMENTGWDREKTIYELVKQEILNEDGKAVNHDGSTWIGCMQIGSLYFVPIYIQADAAEEVGESVIALTNIRDVGID